jgi:hypothetical protein
MMTFQAESCVGACTRAASSNESSYAARFWFALALVSSSRSESALLNQARLDRRDSRLGLTQRLGACMHGVGAQDILVPSD